MKEIKELVSNWIARGSSTNKKRGASIKSLLILTFFCISNKAICQPGPEYFILFHLVSDNELIDASNVQFNYHKVCDNKKRKLKQPSSLENWYPTSAPNSERYKRVNVLHQYGHCEKIIVKVKYQRKTMELHFTTNQPTLSGQYGKFYIHEGIEFVADGVTKIDLDNYVDDSAMGKLAIGLSGVYHWVLTPRKEGAVPIFSRPAKLKVDSIILDPTGRYASVDFALEIGIDSLNRRFPTFCYSQDARRINYGVSFDAYRLSSSGVWEEASREVGLILRHSTQFQLCDPSKVINDESAYDYFKLLKHRFSLNITKPGTYKIVSKSDNTLSTTFVIRELAATNKLNRNPAEINKNSVLGYWELLSIKTNNPASENYTASDFFLQNLRFSKGGHVEILHIKGIPFKKDRIFYKNTGAYSIRSNAPSIIIKQLGSPWARPGITPRGGLDEIYEIIEVTNTTLTLSVYAGQEYGYVQATFTRYE